MVRSNDDLRRIAAGVRLEQCVKSQNVLGRVIDRVGWGEPFLLLETMRDALGTLPVPGAYHLRVNQNGRLRWMALLFGDESLLREARRRKESGQSIVLRARGEEPRLLGDTTGEMLRLTCERDILELSGSAYLMRVLAAHEVVEGPHGLAVLAGRIRKGLPVGLQVVETR